MKKPIPPKNTGEIIIYQNAQNEIDFKVHFDGETVWLRQNQIAKLFNKDRTVITRHINNIFKAQEVNEKSNVQKIHFANSDKPVKLYSLDIILAVGYRTNSANAIKFRKWATKILKNYLIKGYAINQNRLQEKGLKEFEQAIQLITNTIESKELSLEESQGLLKIITNYANSWLILQQYDEEVLKKPEINKGKFILEYQEAKKAIEQLKENLIQKKEASDLFGLERENAFAGIIGNIYQTFDEQDLYEGVEEKAAHLLYFIIKDHPFADGNKRIGSFLFLVFLAKNEKLFNQKGERKFNDNALVSLALLIAESDPKQKEMMIKLVMNFVALG